MIMEGVDWNRVKDDDNDYLWELKNKGYNINWRVWWNSYWSKNTQNYPETYARIIRIINEQKPSNVIDIGCGCGTLVRKIRAEFPDMKIRGFDISDVAINMCTELCSGFIGWVGKFPEQAIDIPETYDMIIMTELLEHITDDYKTIEATTLMLKKDGIFVCSVPDNKLSPDQEKTHVRMYNYESLNKLLSKYYDIIQIEKLNQDEKLLGICKQFKVESQI